MEKLKAKAAVTYVGEHILSQNLNEAKDETKI